MLYAAFNDNLFLNHFKMKLLTALILILMIFTRCQAPGDKVAPPVNFISEATKTLAIEEIKKAHPEADSDRVTRGVNHIATLWIESDGTAEEFVAFCASKFVASEDDLYIFFERVSAHLESLFGHFNLMTLHLQNPIHLDLGEVHSIDAAFGGYSPGAHLINDLYENKIAFQIALNFPYFTLDEKEQLGKSWSRREWAYARLGDVFTSRVPPSIIQNYARVSAATELYINQYNIKAGRLLTPDGRNIFPEEMSLLSHWNLRDQLKANYPEGEAGLERQKLIYQVMLHIINQTIPRDVINNPKFEWEPASNAVFVDGVAVESEREPDTRYQKILDNFNALRQMDPYTRLDTYVRRNFEGNMEISQPEVEALFVEYLSSPLLKEVGQLISERLGRPLQPFDIWYDGFKARGAISESVLSARTRELYPNALAFEEDMDNLLVKLGYEPERAAFIASKITVDDSRGAGHAWGTAMRGMNSYLRTRIPADGLDYKGYNIAMHELGHNVEQTISLYNMDYYMLHGVPNVAFTEALAFIFQKRDLELIGFKSTDPRLEALRTLDLIWASYEIMGVSLLDMRVWNWLYENPNATAEQLRETVVSLAKDIWNQFYAPVYGISDQPILAVYSHMISFPLYLSNYAYGNVIEFQIEEFLRGRNFGNEVDRMFMLGRLTPNNWMQQAVGADISINPLLQAGKTALERVRQN